MILDAGRMDRFGEGPAGPQAATPAVAPGLASGHGLTEVLR
jgi:hypothetical protein